MVGYGAEPAMSVEVKAPNFMPVCEISVVRPHLRTLDEALWMDKNVRTIGFGYLAFWWSMLEVPKKKHRKVWQAWAQDPRQCRMEKENHVCQPSSTWPHNWLVIVVADIAPCRASIRIHMQVKSRASFLNTEAESRSPSKMFWVELRAHGCTCGACSSVISHHSSCRGGHTYFEWPDKFGSTHDRTKDKDETPRHVQGNHFWFPGGHFRSLGARGRIDRCTCSRSIHGPPKLQPQTHGH